MTRTKAAPIPSCDEIRTALLGMSYSAVREMCQQAGVPVTTVWGIRSGATPNPGIETVRAFWPHLPKRGCPSSAQA